MSSAAANFVNVHLPQTQSPHHQTAAYQNHIMALSRTTGLPPHSQLGDKREREKTTRLSEIVLLKRTTTLQSNRQHVSLYENARPKTRPKLPKKKQDK
jgi:hypothetical protein